MYTLDWKSLEIVDFHFHFCMQKGLGRFWPTLRLQGDSLKTLKKLEYIRKATEQANHRTAQCSSAV